MELKLSVNDIHILKNIIIVAASKGLVHPDEFFIIGETYNKLKVLESLINNPPKNGN